MSNKNLDVTTLKFLQVIFRHGHRTPREFYPRDPYKKEKYYPIGLGGLTNEGKKKSFEIGESLREKYGDFLGETVTQNTISALSSNYNRTKATLLLVLAGLYPPKGVQLWKEDLKWQPIPYNYMPKKHDKIFFASFSKENRLLYKNHIETQEHKKYLDSQKELLEYLRVHSGFTLKELGHAFKLFFILQSQISAGLTLPIWTRSIYPKPLEDLVLKYYKCLTTNDIMKQYAAGFLLERILKEIGLKIRGKLGEDLKICLYSGHELNIAFLLILFGFEMTKVPPFVSHIIFELHCIQKEFFLKVLYIDYGEKKTKILTRNTDEEYLSYENFLKAMKKYIPSPELKFSYVDFSLVLE